MPLTGDKKREYDRKWMAKRRKDWFDINGPCVICGSTENLELDHIDRNIKISHRIWSWSEERRLLELSKCQVLCHECHLKKTISESKKEFCLRGHSLNDADRKLDGSLSQCKVCRQESQRQRRKKCNSKKLERKGLVHYGDK